MAVLQDDVASEERKSGDLIDQWFRELDQRRIYQGAQEWLVEVTQHFDVRTTVLWIQMAAPALGAGSVLLCVGPTTSTEKGREGFGRPYVGRRLSPPVVNARRH
jgi:hypothetical protein